MKNFLKKFIPWGASRPSGDVDKRFYQSDTAYDEFLKLIIFPIILVSGYFTFKFLVKFLGVTSIDGKVIAAVVAAASTGGEIYCLRAFVIGKDYRALIGVGLVAATSIWGSMAAFQIGVEINTKQSDAYQLARQNVDQLDQQIKELTQQSKEFREKNQLGNLRDARKALKATQTKREKAYKDLQAVRESGAGEGNAIFRTVANATGWNPQNVAAAANLFIAIVVEFFLMLITVRDSERDERRNPFTDYYYYKPEHLTRSTAPPPALPVKLEIVDEKQPQQTQPQDTRVKQTADTQQDTAATRSQGSNADLLNIRKKTPAWLKELSYFDLVNIISRTLRWMGDYKTAAKYSDNGSVPALTPDQIKQIFEDGWLEGVGSNMVKDVRKHLRKSCIEEEIDKMFKAFPPGGRHDTRVGRQAPTQSDTARPTSPDTRVNQAPTQNPDTRPTQSDKRAKCVNIVDTLTQSDTPPPTSPDTRVNQAPTQNPDTRPTQKNLDIDLESLTDERIVEIVSCVLQVGRHTSGRWGGSWKFTEAGAMAKISKQGAKAVFDRFWLHRKNEGIVPQVVERIRQDIPGISDEAIQKMLKGEALETASAISHSQNGKGA